MDNMKSSPALNSQEYVLLMVATCNLRPESQMTPKLLVVILCACLLLLVPEVSYIYCAIYTFIFLFQVLEAVGPIILLSTDTRKLRNEGFLSPYHPRYPDILTNSAHPMVRLTLN